MVEEEKPISNTGLMTEIIPIARALSADLLKFASSNPGGRVIILDLATSTGSTASVLETFSEFITKYGSCDEEVESKIIPLVCRSLKTKIEIIKAALDETLKNEGDEEWVMGNSAVKCECSRGPVVDSRQEALGAELGGVYKMNVFRRRFEETNETLAFLMNALKYIALKKKEYLKQIEDPEKRELDKIMDTFPARYLGGWKTSILEMVEEANDTETDVNRDDPLPSNRRRPMNDDAISIISWDSFASNQFIENKERYEYWVLQKVPGENRTTRGWSFLGFSAREFVNNTRYSVEGKARPHEEMKAKDEETHTEAQYHAREASINKSIAALPQRLQTDLHFLLEDRKQLTSNLRFEREWSVIEIEPLKPTIKTPARTWSGWWKGEGGIQKWGCILKGETKACLGIAPTSLDRTVQRREYNYEEPVDRVVTSTRPVVTSYLSRTRRRVNPAVPSPEEYEKQLKELLNSITDPDIRLPLKDE